MLHDLASPNVTLRTRRWYRAMVLPIVARYRVMMVARKAPEAAAEVAKAAVEAAASAAKEAAGAAEAGAEAASAAAVCRAYDQPSQHRWEARAASAASAPLMLSRWADRGERVHGDAE